MLALAAGAQPVPLYHNDGTLTNAQIDATTVVNSGVLYISTSAPFSTQNTLNLTNTASGVIQGGDGFQFDCATSSGRRPSANFANYGSHGHLSVGVGHQRD